MVRFSVLTVVDPPDRDGVLASGKVLAGTVREGSTLRIEATGQPVRVVAVDFPTPAATALGRTTLVLDRRDAGSVTVGTMLTD